MDVGRKQSQIERADHRSLCILPLPYQLSHNSWDTSPSLSSALLCSGEIDHVVKKIVKNGGGGFPTIDANRQLLMVNGAMEGLIFGTREAAPQSACLFKACWINASGSSVAP
jgi:hypothetical protein